MKINIEGLEVYDIDYTSIDNEGNGGLTIDGVNVNAHLPFVGLQVLSIKEKYELSIIFSSTENHKAVGDLITNAAEQVIMNTIMEAGKAGLLQPK